MKRWTLCILICIFLGAATTVGVAWGLAQTPLPLPLQGSLYHHIRLGWLYHWSSFSDTGACVVVTGGHSRTAPPVNPPSWRWEAPPSWVVPDPQLTVQCARGFPALSNVARQSVRDPVRLPLRPIFPGFIINILFYAAIWFSAFFGVAALRRFVRTKRGRCVKCSYDLHGAPGDDRGCPECGWNRIDQPPRRRDAARLSSPKSEGVNPDS